MRGSLLDRTYFALFRGCPYLWVLALLTGVSQLAFALVNVYGLPLYLSEQWRLDTRVIGLVITTFLIVETSLKYPMGLLSDRLGRRGFVTLGPLAIAATPVITTLLPRPLWMLIFPLRAWDGVGAAALWPPLYALVGDHVPARHRAAAMSIISTVYAAAIGAAAALGAFASSLAGSDRTAFHLASGLLLSSAVIAYFGLPRTMPECAPEEGEAPPRAPAPVPVPASPRPRWFLWLILVQSLLMTLGVLTIGNFLMLYLLDWLHFARVEVGLLLVGIGVVVVVLGLPLGHLVDRWGKSRAVRASLVASAAFMWLLPSCTTLPLFAAVALLLVLSYILGLPAWLAFVSGLAPTRGRGRMMATVATAEGIGAVLGPPIGGELYYLHPSYMFYGAAAFLTLGALLALILLRERALRSED